MSEYILLLNRYYRLIEKEAWWEDNKREKLVEKMDKIWNRLKNEEQKSVLNYVHLLYSKRIQ